ncbi:30S ribosomal protein S12 methylthiotransferase RimO [Ostreibacterium oceani]|uniref:Ribosomal protein uS12 methylthiotransferase RimO n=1 Tax=Ostreibacterium oceani TaxID=2654998 RepID=A0A6N7F177_9GAMM|nr:30S ribosomal protein S12 methylthiotransferase RimO [Ostreibacterium oceani]MPV86548.1 30S ribosomal protein S12 methylthiotransferase RimO [Ostreibacterium oceani]
MSQLPINASTTSSTSTTSATRINKDGIPSVSRHDDAAKVGFISLGCPKALVDSERILTQLRSDGYEIVNTYEDAGLVIVNTCGFIDSAIAESLDTIGEAIAKNGRVIVTGCLGKDAEKIQQTHPKVLAISGPQAYETVMNQVHEHLPKPKKNPFIDLVPPQGIKLTPRHYAYLKISEGCNHSCTFCIIPDLRGKLVSRPAGDVMAEAERLANAGVQELLVISQDTSAYGVDIKYKTDFNNGQPIKSRIKELCEALARFDIWVRLHYVYPYPSVDDLIPLMAEGKILPYLDIPFQHANHDILRNMKRPAHSEKVLHRIANWRQIVPDIALRSTFIVGFPGETEAQFEELLDFLREARLDRVGAFAYSQVKGAKSNALPNHVPEAVKQERLARLMAIQAEISAEKLADKIGSIQPVMIDEVDTDAHIAIGRTVYDAPEIDGVVQIESIDGIAPGQVIHVEITEATDHDLIAVPA